MSTSKKILILQSVLLILNMFNILKQIHTTEIISLDLQSGANVTGLLNNSQIMVINYRLRNSATLSSNYELSPIVYELQLNLQSKSKEEIQDELSHILPLLIYTRDDWHGRSYHCAK